MQEHPPCANGWGDVSSVPKRPQLREGEMKTTTELLVAAGYIAAAIVYSGVAWWVATWAWVL